MDEHRGDLLCVVEDHTQAPGDNGTGYGTEGKTVTGDKQLCRLREEPDEDEVPKQACNAVRACRKSCTVTNIKLTA